MVSRTRRNYLGEGLVQAEGMRRTGALGLKEAREEKVPPRQHAGSRADVQQVVSFRSQLWVWAGFMGMWSVHSPSTSCSEGRPPGSMLSSHYHDIVTRF